MGESGAAWRLPNIARYQIWQILSKKCFLLKWAGLVRKLFPHPVGVFCTIPEPSKCHILQKCFFCDFMYFLYFQHISPIHSFKDGTLSMLCILLSCKSAGMDYMHLSCRMLCAWLKKPAMERSRCEVYGYVGNKHIIVAIGVGGVVYHDNAGSSASAHPWILNLAAQEDRVLLAQDEHIFLQQSICLAQEGDALLAHTREKSCARKNMWLYKNSVCSRNTCFCFCSQTAEIVF